MDSTTDQRRRRLRVPMRRYRSSRHGDRAIFAIFLVLGLAVLAGLVGSRARPKFSESRSVVSSQGPVSQAGISRPSAARIVEGEDFRFLLAILTGVALGTATLTFQNQLLRAQWGIPFLGQAVLWSASLAAVVLVYLSIMYGSRLAVPLVHVSRSFFLPCYVRNICCSVPRITVPAAWCSCPRDRVVPSVPHERYDHGK